MRRTKRVNFTLLIVIIAIVAGISIGFAALSSTLIIKSKLKVNPNISSGDFKIVFSSSSSSLSTTDVVPEVTTGVTASNAKINNNLVPTISNFSLEFSEKGDKATYVFYVRNEGKLPAYMTQVIFNGYSSSGKFKSCSAISGTTLSTVQAACEDINVTVTVGSQVVTATNRQLNNHLLDTGASEKIILEIEFNPNSTSNPDGDFILRFGDISLLYNTIDNGKVGDVNNDGLVNTSDAILLSKYLAGHVSSIASPTSGDMNGDDIIDYQDVNLLSQQVGYVKSVPGLVGDANSDGILNDEDYTLLLSYLSNASSVTEENCDMNQDGEIQMNDAIYLMQLVQGSITKSLS